VQYDSIEDTVHVDGKSFDRAEGNLFVVLVDPEWQIVVQQLPVIVETRELYATVLAHIKAASPQNRRIQSLQLRTGG